jgi:hypothetical protein
MQIRIKGIVYGDRVTEYEPIRNDKPDKAWRWENGPMIEASETMFNDLDSNDLVGVFSHKFKEKTGISKSNLYRFLKDSKKADVYNFCRGHGKHIHFMDWSNQGHPGIKDFIRRCCDHVGMVYTNDPKHIVYANQFVATKHVYLSYINELIKPCLELLEGPMWEEVNVPASYTRAMPAERLKELTGLDFYNYVPFILERMMCQFIHSRKLVVSSYYTRP